MSPYQSLFAPAARSLSGHLDRVRANLATIARQKRESVSTTLGRAAADAVRQAVAYLMRQAGEVTVPVQEASYGYDARRDSRWAGHDHDRLDEWDDRDEFHRGQQDRHWRDSREYEPDEEYHPTRPARKTEPVWRSTLAAACRLIAWCWAGWLPPARCCWRWIRAWPPPWPCIWPVQLPVPAPSGRLLTPSPAEPTPSLASVDAEQQLQPK